MFLKEGVFNQVGTGLTVYIREKDGSGELRGILINDSRERNKIPSTVIAKRGALISNDDGFEVLVYDGSRQEYDPAKKILSRLDFDNYKVDFPNMGEVRQRWAEPDERTIFELFNPDLDNTNDVRNLREFKLEVHKRFISPFLALSFALIGCASLLLGPYDRRGQSRRIMLAVISATALQGLYLTAFNFARNSDFGLVLMYALVIAPVVLCLFLLSRASETMRRQMLYGAKS